VKASKGVGETFVVADQAAKAALTLPPVAFCTRAMITHLGSLLIAGCGHFQREQMPERVHRSMHRRSWNEALFSQEDCSVRPSSTAAVG
jgi:hypothetical protein